MAKARSTSKAPRTVPARKERRRFWLNYPPKQIQRPLIWELSQKFDVVFDIRQASVTEDIGILCLELEAFEKELKAVIAWLEKHGVKVEPVEISVIEA